MSAVREISLPLRAARWMQWLALIAFIIGARLWLISGYGSALPILDQWEAEAGSLFKPWLENTLRCSDLFASHNEHRIVLTRLLALGLLQANGQWDALLEITVNAALCGLIGLGIAAGLLRILGSDYRGPVLVAVTLWLALPYAHENTLWGFQSAFYFLLVFSFLAIWGLGFFPSYSRNWWLGAIGAVLACFSMASGFFAAGVILILETIRLLLKRRGLSKAAPTCVFAIAVVTLGVYFRVNFPPHEALKAASAGAWLTVIARSLAWPYCALPILIVIMYLPWAICLFLMARTNGRLSQRPSEILFTIGLWVIVQAAAIAYARGEHGNVPIASRYMDILGLGAVINALCVVAVVRSIPRTGRHHAAALVFGAIWLAVALGGATGLGLHKLSSGPGKEALLPMEENVRAYVATHDPKYLAGDRPYPDLNRLANLLDDPTIRKILPTIVRPALPLEFHQNTGNAFVANGYPAQLTTPPYERAWGSYSQSGRETRGAMESKSFHSELPYLQFEVAGSLARGLSLSLRDDERGKEVRVNSKVRLNENWRPAIVPRPSAKMHIIANDDSEKKWFAFREPRELGRFGYYSTWAVSNGRNLLIFGVTLSVLSILNKPMSLFRLSLSRRFHKPVASEQF
ncbi:MAG: hypothetical protein M3N48_00910 [Verrucomicrobiota bacterium]|nr:hypothetical protein [Verrucomicrobiota bacterium]